MTIRTENADLAKQVNNYNIKMYKRFLTIVFLAAFMTSNVCIHAQENNDENVPTITYTGNPKKYEIGGIEVEGMKNYEDYVLIGLSGLSVGQVISVPGDEITEAIKRYWKNGLFSDVKILATKIEDGKVYLKILLTQRPRISEIRYHGVKKSEKEDLQEKLGLVKGNQITPNVIDRAEIIIKRHFDEKGFKNAEVNIVQRDDVSAENQVILDINIDKKEKVKVNSIVFEGNTALSELKLRRTMKKTSQKGYFLTLFKPKKFIEEKFKEDKQLIIDKYNELGYRDAKIVSADVTPHNEKTVDLKIKIDEGQKYYLRNVSWVGNTLYSTDWLNYVLNMKKGDVYNQKKLNERLMTDEDAVGNLYYNNGYLFYQLDPVEVNIEKDSIDLEMRIYEGKQATINKVIINGNDRLYDHVVRRELRTKPGALFSKEDMERSYREIAQMGHFNPENIDISPEPNPEEGTVDLVYNLESKANDQIEFSAGWGQTGVIGKLSLKFTNFSARNLFRRSDNYKGILPQGDGQTLTISGQTNAQYYQSYSFSFFDPWFGGKRPNSFSISAYYSKQTDISDRYYNSALLNNYYSSLGGYGYGSYYNNYNSYESYYDPDQSVQIWGAALSFGKRLKWPDDYFTFSTELTYQRYKLKDWRYFPVTNGNCNDLSISLTWARNSTDNPIYPRRGSEFMVSAQITPPYSLISGKDYSKYAQSPSDPNWQDDQNKMHKWVEYHKWKFKLKTYTALSSKSKCPVLMSRLEFGILGHYNKYKKSPFGTFDVGGDGMSGYSSGYYTETIALRGYESNSLTPNLYSTGYAYTRLSLELRQAIVLETSTQVYALAFVEAGNAWHDVKDFNPFDLKRSAGVGVRIFLPMIGLMGIDWAYGFDPVFGSKQYSRSQFHFILGQEF